VARLQGNEEVVLESHEFVSNLI